jgi:fatty-acyl-CoA synthase
VSVHQGRRYSYAALAAEVDRLASALLGLGLRPGERIGIWSHNNVEWVLMQLATAKVGLVLVNINPAYRTAELEYALNKVGCKALVSMAQFKTSDYLGMLRELAPELATCAPGASCKRRACPNCAPWPGSTWRARAPSSRACAALFRTAGPRQVGDPRVAQAAAGHALHDPINIQFTSGTTGFPKGATLTHRNILNNGFFIGEA